MVTTSRGRARGTRRPRARSTRRTHLLSFEHGVEVHDFRQSAVIRAEQARESGARTWRKGATWRVEATSLL